ncbi:hypothetical protein [Nonomuraea sp. KM88]|uniref:hypothetical protein n=1 Tax=Nonomuraea sp. KM88 TaxID=3457427 RepID=UPI003FCC59D0
MYIHDGERAAETADDGQEPTSETAAEDDDFDVLAFIKPAVGNVSLESMVTEIRKLAAVRAIELPPGSEGRRGAFRPYPPCSAVFRDVRRLSAAF